MAIPKMKEITVTTVQDILTSNRRNQTVTAAELGIHRKTLRDILDSGRPNVVLVDNGEYILLK